MVTMSLGSTAAAALFLAVSLASPAASAGAHVVPLLKPGTGVERMALPMEGMRTPAENFVLLRYDGGASTAFREGVPVAADQVPVNKGEKPAAGGTAPVEPASKPGPAVGEGDTGK